MEEAMQDEIDELRQAIEQAEKQEPVDAVLLSDMVEGHHPEYGRGLFATDNCVQKLYTNSPTAPAEIDFLQHDDHLRFIQRVLESDSPKSDRDEAAQMVRDIRRSIRPTAPAQQPLTVDQVHKGLYNDFKESSKNMRDAYFAGVRFAEKYHGIKGASL
jgi:hypothetical protein